MALLRARLARAARGPRRTAVLLLLLLLALAGAAVHGAVRPATAQAGEYEVKAAFLYNFAKFVDWPPDAFADPAAPLTFCIVGADPFGPTLDNLVQSDMVAGRRIAVRRHERSEDLRACHLVFVAGSQRRHLREILAPLRDRAVFTVGEEDGFLEAGGILRFVLVGGKVRFRINEDAVGRSPLTVSSKLLRLAQPPLEGSP